MNPEILIATNGSKESWPAVEYGAWLGATLKSRIVLLGAVEHMSEAAIDEAHPLEACFAQATELFRTQGLEYKLEVENGSAEVVVPRRARDQNFITVLGPLGRPRLKRWLTGRSISHLMAEIHGPIVYVPHTRLPLKKLLIALGGLGYELTAEHLALQIAVQTRAEIALLHVVPPVDLDYPTARIMRTEWRHLDDTNTPVGRRLREAMDLAKSLGLTAAVVARQGIVVEEILAEVRQGNYDLLCMGSPYSTSALRQLYAPNVTADIAEAVDCPVLTARFKKE
jgi:nucleotide-binding universal stress UspA family protein